MERGSDAIRSNVLRASTITLEIYLYPSLQRLETRILTVIWSWRNFTGNIHIYLRFWKDSGAKING